MSVGTIIDSTKQSRARELLQSIYPNPATYGKFEFYNCDPRHYDPSITVDESLADLVLGDGEGETPVADFLAQMQALMVADLTDHFPTLLNYSCGVVVRDNLFPSVE